MLQLIVLVRMMSQLKHAQTNPVKKDANTPHDFQMGLKNKESAEKYCFPKNALSVCVKTLIASRRKACQITKAGNSRFRERFLKVLTFASIKFHEICRVEQNLQNFYPWSNIGSFACKKFIFLIFSLQLLLKLLSEPG